MRKLKQQPISLRGPIGPMSPISPRGPMSPISPISPMSPRGLLGLLLLLALLLGACCHDDDEKPVQEKGTPITFSGSEAETQQATKAPRASMASMASEASMPSRASMASTRAAMPLESKATAFDVWGYKNMILDDTDGYTKAGLQTVIPQYHVAWKENSAATTTTNSDGWEYILTDYPDQTIKFWDFGAKAYRFFAATGYPAATVKTVDGNEVAEISMAADGEDLSATSYYSRLWFSTGDYEHYPDKQFGKTVALEFALPLSRVRFILRTVVPEGSPEPILEDIEYKPITGKIHVRGTFTVTYPLTGESTTESWTTSDFTRSILSLTVPYSEDEYFTQAEIDAAVEGDPAYDKTTSDKKIVGTYKWYYLMPIRGQEPYMLTLLINGEEKTAVVPAAYMDWLPGYEYTYIFKINEEGGVELESYDAAYADWKEGTEGTPTVYNW